MLNQDRIEIEDHRELAMLDVQKFPAAMEFRIELFEDGSTEGLCLRFVDSRLDMTVEFPWWDDVERELRQWSISDIPLGSLDRPFYDLEQGWQILVWRTGEWVFIMQGDDDSLHTWVRVPVNKYISEWGVILNRVQRQGI